MRQVVGFAVIGLLVSGCGSGDKVERVHAAWSLRAAPTDDQLPITVHIGSGSCNKFDGLLVTESATEVSVEAFVNHRERKYCTLEDGMRFEIIQLASPLGTRRLVGCYIPAEEQTWLDPSASDRVECADRLETYP